MMKSWTSKPYHPMRTLQILNTLERADLSKISLNFLEKHINLIFKGYVKTAIILSNADGRFHRAIKYSHRPTYIRELSYPPTDKARLCRANLPQKPMFYCSGNPRATFFELGLNPGDTVVLSKWRLTNEITLFPIGYSKQIFIELGSDRKAPILIPYQHPKELTKSNVRINNFLANKFTQKIESGKEHLYKITAIFTEKFLTASAKCGIVYPSIAMRANAENFALTPLAADQCLQLKSAHWYRVDVVENFSYKVTPLAIATSFQADGHIEWRLPSEEEKKYL